MQGDLYCLVCPSSHTRFQKNSVINPCSVIIKVIINQFEFFRQSKRFAARPPTCCDTIPHIIDCVRSPSSLCYHFYAIFNIVACMCLCVSRHPSASLHLLAPHSQPPLPRIFDMSMRPLLQIFSACTALLSRSFSLDRFHLIMPGIGIFSSGKKGFGIDASIWSFVPGMFGSRTLWFSGRYLTTSRFPKDMHIFRAPRSWNWKNRKLEEHLPWGRSQKNEVCTGGVFLHLFTTFVYLAESCGSVQQIHF